MDRTDHEFSSPVVPIRFELRGEEYTSVARSGNSFALLLRVSAIFSFVASGAFLFISWANPDAPHVSTHYWFLLVGLVNAGSGLFGLVSSKLLYPRCARRAELRVDAAGFLGELDGCQLSLPWKSVDSVTGDGEFFLVRSAAAKNTIAIPKRAVASASDLWHSFDDRLTAKRGLIVRPDRRLILNTARA
jgi:hypothetical protein